MNKKRILQVSLAIAVSIGVPLSFFIVAKVLHKDQLNMPRYYIADRIDSSIINGKMVYDTTYHRVAELTGINQFGDVVGLNKDLANRILVVDFFFTTCPSVCPQLTRNMRLLQNAYRRTPMANNDTIVQFISITVNPERDSFPVLFDYAKRYGADMNHWWFITSNKKDLYNYARHELHVAAPDGDGGADDFIHTEQMVLIDRNRHIRGYYNGLDSLEVGKCAFDIGRLNMEKEHKKMAFN